VVFTDQRQYIHAFRIYIRRNLVIPPAAHTLYRLDTRPKRPIEQRAPSSCSALLVDPLAEKLPHRGKMLER
jgi:hypothetical protein